MLRKLDFLNFFDAIVLTNAQYIEQNPMVLSEFVIIRTQCTNEGYLQVHVTIAHLNISFITEI